MALTACRGQTFDTLQLRATVKCESKPERKKARVRNCTSLVKLCFLAFLSFGFSFAPASQRAPNFIIIVADDLGYGDLGVYGHSAIRTRNLDRMGVRLTNFYAAISLPEKW